MAEQDTWGKTSTKIGAPAGPDPREREGIRRGEPDPRARPQRAHGGAPDGAVNPASRRENLAGQGGLKQALHRGGMDGLGQMRVETGLSRLTLVLGQSIAGQGDEPKFLTVRRRPDALGHLV